jgi:hypothetical protein
MKGDQFESFKGATLADVETAFRAWLSKSPRQIMHFSRKYYPGKEDTGYPSPSGSNLPDPYFPVGQKIPVYMIDVIYRDLEG